ncbi:MAG TPA: SpoVR family protein, partial [Geminicoccaceae bacterium]|nr:SpoVR family protein [Geminicoccaceae bacterium]
MANWDIKDLEYWDAAIRERVAEYGLDCYPQEFEICDHAQMLGYTAYHGMPAHYPHWSYGKSYEKTKTMYDHGVVGLPYELVINSNPCLAYLMRDNTLCLQILTIAHVYGHNDFFKNNFTFTSATRAEQVLGQFKARADRVRDYCEDPSIGLERVERLLDAAHALSLNCRRNPAIRKLRPEEQRQRRLEAAEPRA